jgi:hypothetical protein
MEYLKIKEWYLANMDKLPTVLLVSGAYYRDLPETVRLYIDRIESETLRLGPDINKSAIASSSEFNLRKILRALKDRENWDVEFPERYKGKFVNKQ